MSKTDKFGFVLMPFKPEFDNQWEFAITPALQEVGLRPVRADEEFLGTNIIVKDITRLIFEAAIVLADLTDRNANVMYELGLAHAAKKPVIIMAQSEKDVPFDLQHIRCLPYDRLDLKALRSELLQRLRSTLAMTAMDSPDFFPELKIMGGQERAELEYLRTRATTLEIVVDPPTADIFFNDRWLGSTSATVNVNTRADRAAVSATAAEHLEYYEVVSDKVLETGRLNITLEPGRPKAEQEKRMPRWLRLRRQNPNSPVLMKAISQYLCEIGAFDDALEEAQALMLAVPNWPVSYGHLGDVHHRMRNYQDAISYWETAVALKPDYAVPLLGLACAYSITGNYPKCLVVIQQIRDSDDLLLYYSRLGHWRIENDPDFDTIRRDADYGERFGRLVDEINRKVAELKSRGTP